MNQQEGEAGEGEKPEENEKSAREQDAGHGSRDVGRGSTKCRLSTANYLFVRRQRDAVSVAVAVAVAVAVNVAACSIK